MKSPLLLSFLIGIVFFLSARSEPAHPLSNESTQVIDVTAKKYEFDPPTIRVKQGTRVQLRIRATDHVHGMKLSNVPNGGENGKPGLVFASSQDCMRIEEGKTETVEFVAQNPGTYPFRCCVHCGWHHRAMKGEVIVEP